MDAQNNKEPPSSPSPNLTPSPPKPAPPDMEYHDRAVAAIAARVRAFAARGQPFGIYHGSTNSTRRLAKRRDATVDTSGLDRVLAVDAAARTALVEPNVSMDALVAATLTPHGLVPPVVMEFPGITAGGGFSGTSGESSSFRHGAFDATVNWIEVVLPTGEVVRAGRTGQGCDLFWGAASAFGTLGVVTLLEVRLVEARRFVRLEYHLSRSVEDAVERIRMETEREENDYVDGVVFSRDAVVACAGRLVDDIPPGMVEQRFTRRKDPWFYIHVEKHILPRLRDDEPVADYIPLTDYLFRWDRGGFWGARWAFQYFRMPFNRVTRYVLDPLMRTRTMYRALHQSGLSDYYMAQDVGVPLPAAASFASWLDAELGIYPIWLCPLRLRRDGGADAAHGLHSQFASDDPEKSRDLLNFGIWGALASRERREVVERNRALEGEVARLGGKKWLYAQGFYTEDEFWAQYDRASYEALRARYGAGYLPSVFEKVCVDVDAERARARAAATATKGERVRRAAGRVWPMRGLYGVYKAVGGGDYLLKKGGKGS